MKLAPLIIKLANNMIVDTDSMLEDSFVIDTSTIAELQRKNGVHTAIM